MKSWIKEKNIQILRNLFLSTYIHCFPLLHVKVIFLINIFFQNQHQEKSSTAITVFVGNITEKASDALVRQILTVCTCTHLLYMYIFYCMKLWFIPNFMLKNNRFWLSKFVFFCESRSVVLWWTGSVCKGPRENYKVQSCEWIIIIFVHSWPPEISKPKQGCY